MDFLAHSSEDVLETLTTFQVTEKKLNSKVAYIEGDHLLTKIQDDMGQGKSLQHSDAKNLEVTLDSELNEFAKHPHVSSIVSANAYLGARGIAKGHRDEVDIAICGCVADTSLVIGLAA